MYLEDYLASLASGRPSGGSELSKRDRATLAEAGMPVQISKSELENMGPAYRNQLMREVVRGQAPNVSFVGDQTPRAVEDLLTAEKLAPLFGDQASLEQFFRSSYGRSAPRGAQLSVGGLTPQVRQDLKKIDLTARRQRENKVLEEQLKAFRFNPQTGAMEPIMQDPYDKLEKVPSKELGEYSGATAGIKSIDDAIRVINGEKVGNTQGVRDSFGGFGGTVFGRTPFVGGQLLNWWDPEGVPTRAFVKNIGAAVRREIAGQAVSGGEAIFTEDMIPQVYDSDTVVKDKLRAIQAAFQTKARTFEEQFNPQTGYRPLSARGAPGSGLSGQTMSGQFGPQEQNAILQELQRRGIIGGK